MSCHLSPASSVARQQFIGPSRPLAAGLVTLQSLGAGLLPGIEKGLYRLPAGLDAVGALEQDVITDHAVVNQRFIAGGGLHLEVVLVAEFHLDAVDIDR